MEMSTAGAIVLQMCSARCPVQNRKGNCSAALLLQANSSSRSTSNSMEKSHKVYGTFVRFYTEKDIFLALTANVMNTAVVPISLILREPTHHDRGNVLLGVWIPETLF